MKRVTTSFVVVFTTAILVLMITTQCKSPDNTGNTSLTNSKDTLLYSFAVLGCNRLDKDDTAAAHQPSTANANQLLKTFADIAAMKPMPDYLFMAGDLVIGYSPDTNVMATELRAWRKLYENTPLSKTGIKLVTLPGNHEVMEGKKKPAYADAESIWATVMAPYIAGNNGPKAHEADSLASDQSRLTYSFDYKNSHFVMLNTDPVGREAGVPVKWIGADITAAKAKGAKHIFAIGHKPAFPYANEDGMEGSDRLSLWTSMEKNRGEAMIAAHNHVYYRVQPNLGKTTQIIAGNGGSPLSDYVTDAKLKFFGYTVISVYTNGKVVMRSYGRDLPATGYAGKAEGMATTVRDSADLTFH